MKYTVVFHRNEDGISISVPGLLVGRGYRERSLAQYS